MALKRCHKCGYKWGSSKTEGYCKTCYPIRYDDEDEKHAFADFVGTHDTGGFFPKEFGIIKDKFGYEER